MTPEAFLAQLRGKFDIAASDSAVRPERHGEFGVYVGRRWHRLVLPSELAHPADPVQRLDVSLLTEHVLAPILGIGDVRLDPRVDFVGGGRGLAELERRVDSGEMAAAFSLYPTPMEDLMAIADTGGVMPPKSTWFDPKLADGLVSHVLDYLGALMPTPRALTRRGATRGAPGRAHPPRGCRKRPRGP